MSAPETLTAPERYTAHGQDRPRRVNEINAVFATLAKEGADGSE